MSTQQDSANLLRVLISTDNHLGVWEKDEVRKDDSFNSFEEVLELASRLQVDFVLLGGDLFHDNKPSRSTVLKAIRLCKKYCLNDNPIQFQVLSDRNSSFVEGCINFEDPNLNIGLPVFTIHGNHDDPSGQDNSSAVEQLSSAGLINYFGKVPLSGSNIGRISLAPILIEKGTTRMALYGLGNIREERLGRLFQTPGCVQWLKPAATEDISSESWLNLFVVHQNRVQHGALAKSCLQERYIPSFIDLVVWGHEHECRADPQLIVNPDVKFEGDRTGFVLQPGSSVATALTEGEAKKKHAVLLEVKGDQWRTIKYPLETVRPFMWGQVVLKDHHDLEPTDQEAINNLLESKVQEMMDAAKLEHPTPNGQPPVLPLIRLRVDYTGFSTINSQRFGQKFVNKVANPHDILLWTKAAQRRKGETTFADDGDSLPRPEALDQSRIEDLIAQHLPSMDILPQDELSVALHNYVEKDDKDAIAKCVHSVLEETQRQVTGHQTAGHNPGAEEELDALLQASIEHVRTQKFTSATPSRAGLSELDLVSSLPPTSRVTEGLDIDGEADAIEDDHGDDIPTPARGRGRGRGKTAAASQSTARGRARGRGRVGGSAASQAGMRQPGIQELFSQPTTQAGKRAPAQKRAAPAAAATARTTQRTSRARPAAKQTIQDDDDDVEMVDDDDNDADAHVDEVIEDSDDDDDVIEDSPPQQTARGRKAAPAKGGQKGAAAKGGRAGGRGRGATKAAAAESSGMGGGSVVDAGYVDSDEEPRPTQRRVPSFLKPASNQSKGSQGPGRWGAARS